MADIRLDLASLLIDVECELRNLGEWSHVPPSPAALASTQPFCIDTLTFSQWMQFVFVVRMRSLLESDTPLPRQCGIAPMAEEYFRGLGLDVAELVRLLNTIDEKLSSAS
ncbi:uncharacterized protein YqcC (DUF446 family) [Alteromonadaceae bacterium 2753L.S.0a.02]|nr:uncharacterized protein YqcC (DUF446 family) [Alteromonadaceae bacterium 2753L.S.0a.02]